MKALIQSAYWLLVVLSCAGLSHLRQPITDLLSNFYAHFALIGLALVVIGCWCRLPRTVLVSAAIAIICSGFIFSYDRVALTENSKAVKTYRIMTFNASEQVKIMEQLKAYLRQEKPDFVILQEITVKDWRSLKELSDIYPAMSYCDDWLCGVAFLSKHKWALARAENFGPFQLPMIFTSFGSSLKGLQIYAIHSARPHWKFSTQRQQFEHFAKYLAVQKNTPTIVAGDMNSTGSSVLLRDFGAYSGLKPIGDFLATWPQRLHNIGNLPLPFLQLDIDHILVRPNFKILRKWRGPDLGSDHRPLLIEFQL